MMIFDEVRDIIVDTLACEEDQVKMETSLSEDLDADSLSIVELTMALEENYGISIADEEAAALKTVGDIVNYIESHKNA